jgi:hypothetical protein
LIDCVHEAESRVEAASRNGAGSVDHGKKSECNGCSLKDTVIAFLSLLFNLADDALAEEEGAPELKEEDFTESIKEHATCLLIIGAQKCWLTHTEVRINDTEETSNALSNDDHSYK